MGDNSKIEWLRLVEGMGSATWNVVRGCKEMDEGCNLCYAKYAAANPRLGGPGKAYEGLTITNDNGEVQWSGNARFVAEKLNEPLTWRKPRMIFTNSMSDWLHKDITDDQVDQILDVMISANWHVSLPLTRRSQRLMFTAARRPHWPAHIWAGVTIPSDKYLYRLDHLKYSPVGTRWVSFEPLLGDIGRIELTGIHWVVAGGESGPPERNPRPSHAKWYRRLRDICREQSVPFFFKQWGAWAPYDQVPGPALKLSKRDALIDIEGNIGSTDKSVWNQKNQGLNVDTTEMVALVGKTNAGRELDGAEWNEYPINAVHYPREIAAALFAAANRETTKFW